MTQKISKERIENAAKAMKKWASSRRFLLNPDDPEKISRVILEADEAFQLIKGGKND